jgi:SAM-dependent methyltransferase
MKTRVEQSRWQEAQSWEERHWISAQRARARMGKNYLWRILRRLGIVPHYRGDDHNLWWQREFDGYRFLPREVDNAIELGCGPYTNMRLIREVCATRHLFLSDPLIRTYVDFELTSVADMHRKAFCTLDDHPVESCPFRPGYFDLCVMINVLDHVQDADACMTCAMDLVKPGGYFIFGQDLKELPEETWKADAGDIGHPIKVEGAWIERHLQRGMDPVLKKVLPREKSRDPHFHSGTYVFAGRRRPATA